MTKGDLINAVAKATKTSKRVAEKAVNATFANLGKAIKRTKRVQVPGFGTFSLRLRKARNGRESSNWRRDQNQGESNSGIQACAESKERSLEGRNSSKD